MVEFDFRVVRHGCPRALRTEHASFPAHGSSYKGSIRHPAILFKVGELLISGVTQVIDIKIDCRDRSTLSQLYDMPTMPRRIFGHRQTEHKPIASRSPTYQFEHFLTATELEILIPIGGIRGVDADAELTQVLKQD
ncbi:hypothetical protein [Pseudomonas sp. CCC2.2]|uniref:hypothetical protein n=1 Tax=Pseudomonas sp. CCC2.2 TaxID=3048605 RepID=UPI002B22B88B|nr:hypothetical protein [Pseudomonas sp. CCC2.2]MEB0150680.1 hypothetical protein [Pseudomonas sp. CCC2.2]